MALLEKQLIKDTANVMHLPVIYYLDDRKACYDRHLPDIEFLADRFFGIDQN